VSEKWVVNASPLILLGAASRLELLTRLCEDLIVPQAVAREVASGKKEDRAAQWLGGEGAAFIGSGEWTNPSVDAWGLGLGESAVLSYAIQHPGREVILDDLAARKCAHVHGLLYRGTIGVVVLAKRRNLIPAVRPVLEELVKAGLWRNDTLFQRALREAGESG
jgi:predicted nucleic acid-binding protein